MLTENDDHRLKSALDRLRGGKVIAAKQAGEEQTEDRRQNMIGVHSVAALDNVEALKSALLTGRVEINQKNKSGDTALMQAVWYGSTASARILINAGTGLDITNNAGQTALDIAKARGRTEIAQMLQQGPEEDRPAATAAKEPVQTPIDKKLQRINDMARKKKWQGPS